MKSQLWAKREMRWATMASFREGANCGLKEKENGQLWPLLEKEIANCGLREKENGQLWPLLEKSQLWVRRRKMGNCDLF
jgi:hypothetical protein